MLELRPAVVVQVGAGVQPRYLHPVPHPKGSPESALTNQLPLISFLLLSPLQLQDVDCFFLSKAELGAKVGRMEGEFDFLRLLYEEVSSSPLLQLCISQADLGGLS